MRVPALAAPTGLPNRQSVLQQGCYDLEGLEVTMMSRFQCSQCDKTFKGERGLAWHLEHAHTQAGRYQSAPQSAVPCSPAANEFINQVAAKARLSKQEALDVLVSSALDNELLESVLDTWDPAITGPENASWWLPLSVIDHQGQRITL